MNLATIYDYWFNMRPPLLPRAGVITLILLGLLCIYLIYLAKNKQKIADYNKPLWYSLKNFAITNLVISWLLAGFYRQGIPLFSAKFWLLLWVIGNAFYLKMLYARFKKLPGRLAEIHQEKSFKKYIPKKAK